MGGLADQVGRPWAGANPDLAQEGNPPTRAPGVVYNTANTGRDWLWPEKTP